RPDAFRRRWFLLFVFLLAVGGLDLGVAPLALDAVAVEKPERGPGVEPAEHHHVPGDALQEQPPGVVLAEVVEVRDDRHVQPRLHDQGRGEGLFEGALGGVLALRLRQDDGDAVTVHGCGQSSVLILPLMRRWVFSQLSVKNWWYSAGDIRLSPGHSSS